MYVRRSSLQPLECLMGTCCAAYAISQAAHPPTPLSCAPRQAQVALCQWHECNGTHKRKILQCLLVLACSSALAFTIAKATDQITFKLTSNPVCAVRIIETTHKWTKPSVTNVNGHN